MGRMVPGIWHKASELVGDGNTYARVARTLSQLVEAGLVERELIAGSARRYEYRLTSVGLRRRGAAVAASPAHGLRPSWVEERLADWKRLGREVSRWLKQWLREFIP